MPVLCGYRHGINIKKMRQGNGHYFIKSFIKECRCIFCRNDFVMGYIVNADGFICLV